MSKAAVSMPGEPGSGITVPDLEFQRKPPTA
jgi:hypothetical protein